MRTRVLLVVVAAGLVMASCGSDEETTADVGEEAAALAGSSSDDRETSTSADGAGSTSTSTSTSAPAAATDEDPLEGVAPGEEGGAEAALADTEDLEFLDEYDDETTIASVTVITLFMAAAGVEDEESVNNVLRCAHDSGLLGIELDEEDETLMPILAMVNCAPEEFIAMTAEGAEAELTPEAAEAMKCVTSEIVAYISGLPIEEQVAFYRDENAEEGEALFVDLVTDACGLTPEELEDLGSVF